MSSIKSFFKINLPRKIDLLLIIRGFLAYAVLVWHFKGYEYPIKELAFITIPGRMAVWLFFILSGYLIGFGFSSGRYSYDQKGLLDYYRNRILRIIPLFLTVSVFAWICTENKPNFSFQFIIEQILMLQWNHHYDLNGVFWTLGLEMQFYIIAPLLCYVQFKKNFSLKKSLLYYLVFLLLPILAHEFFMTGWDIRALYANLALFQIGIICSQIFTDHFIQHMNRSRIQQATLLTMLMLFIGNLLYYTKPGVFLTPVGIIVVSLIGTLFILLHRVLEYSSLEQTQWTKLLSVFGVLSYGIYAWHTFIFSYFKTDSFLLASLGTLLFSISSYYFVEKKLLNLKVKR